MTGMPSVGTKPIASAMADASPKRPAKSARPGRELEARGAKAPLRYAARNAAERVAAAVAILDSEPSENRATMARPGKSQSPSSSRFIQPSGAMRVTFTRPDCDGKQVSLPSGWMSLNVAPPSVILWLPGLPARKPLTGSKT